MIPLIKFLLRFRAKKYRVTLSNIQNTQESVSKALIIKSIFQHFHKNTQIFSCKTVGHCYSFAMFEFILSLFHCYKILTWLCWNILEYTMPYTGYIRL